MALLQDSGGLAGDSHTGTCHKFTQPLFPQQICHLPAAETFAVLVTLESGKQPFGLLSTGAGAGFPAVEYAASGTQRGQKAIVTPSMWQKRQDAALWRGCPSTSLTNGSLKILQI